MTNRGPSSKLIWTKTAPDIDELTQFVVPIIVWSDTRFKPNPSRSTCGAGLVRALKEFLSANNSDTKIFVRSAFVTKPVTWPVSPDKSKCNASTAGASDLRSTGRKALPFKSKREWKGYRAPFIDSLPVKAPLGASCNANQPELSGTAA